MTEIHKLRLSTSVNIAGTEKTFVDDKMCKITFDETRNIFVLKDKYGRVILVFPTNVQWAEPVQKGTTAEQDKTELAKVVKHDTETKGRAGRPRANEKATTKSADL